MERGRLVQAATAFTEVDQSSWGLAKPENLSPANECLQDLGRVATEVCMCNLRETATREGLLDAEEGRPAITIEGEKFTVPEELVEWLHSDSRRAQDLIMRRDAWRKLADLFWRQESRIKELLRVCADDTQSCADTECRKRLEVRKELLDKLWDISTEQRIHAKLLSRDPVDAPYASYRYSA